MVPSMSVFRSPDRRRRTTAYVAVALVVVVLLNTAPARAYINAVVSHDLPVLMEIAATEAASYLELAAILEQAVVMVKTAKEYTTIAKTAWGAIGELRHMSWEDLKNAALTGGRNAFPELATIYGDWKDIRDLDYRDHQALMTVRGMLWENAYGPGMDYLHSAHGNFEVVAASQEHRGRQALKLTARRTEAERWEEDCRRTSANGDAEGACQGAANRAEIQQALMLGDLHETELRSLEAQERMILNQDRRELDTLYAYDRFVFDLRNYMRSAASAASGNDEECPAGRCLFQRYGSKMHERIGQFRARHPTTYSYRVTPSPGDLEGATP